jgi:acyl-CoA synthetase (AMP-forming)/AMP-acid ligase II
MKKLGLLKPDMYPNLRLTLFCGEGLPVDIVKAWAEAAPNSAIENLYGPTEATIACAAYGWDRNGSAQEAELGLVPIGEPFPHMEALILDENLVQVPLGTPGELLVSGPQVALGYWQDAEKTARSFVVPSGHVKTYYRTGDRVRLPADGKPLMYLGRVDNQIKVLGHRVELGEVEAALRQESGVDGAIAVGWPISPSGAGGIEAFLQTEYADIPSLREKLTKRLPSYMVPRNIHLVGKMPLNANGKFDRRALIQVLEEQQR